MITPEQAAKMLAACARNPVRYPQNANLQAGQPLSPTVGAVHEIAAAGRPAPAEREVGKGGLQQEIIDWCDARWPKWVYDFPRTDLKSTLPLGRHDSTIWGEFPTCFLIETKAKGKKRTPEQLQWAARLRMLGWDVKVIYSLEEFLLCVAEA